MRQHSWAALVALLMSMTIAACGGGSGSPEPSPPGPVVPGATALPAQLGLDGPVSAEPGATAVWRPAGLAEGADLSYDWRFGDGGKASTREATHAWAAAGDFEVTLTVRNGAGVTVTGHATARIAAAMVAGLECSGGTGRGWCFLASTGRTRELSDLAFAANGAAMAVGEAGTVISTTDGGQHWTLQPPAGGGRVAGLRLLADGQAWALSGDTLVHSVDAGRSWETLGPAPSSLFWVVDAQRLVANATLPPSPTFWAASHSQDGGRSWQSGALMSLFEVSPTGVVMGWEADGARALAFSHDLGRSITSRLDCAIGGACEVKAYTLADEAAFVVVTLNTVGSSGEKVWMRHRSGDGGRQWQSQPIPWPPGSNLKLTGGGLAFSVQGSEYPARSEKLFRSTDDGQTWEPLGAGLWPDDARLTENFVLGGPALWVQAAGGALLSTDRGQSWRRLAVAGESEAAADLRRAADGRLLAGFGRPSVNGMIQPVQRWYSSADGGQQWTKLPGGSVLDWADQIRSVAFASASRGVALFGDGVAATTDDGGRHWLRQPPTAAHLPAGRLRLAADGSGVMLLGRTRYATLDGGRNWQASSPADFVDLDHGWRIFASTPIDPDGTIGKPRFIGFTTDDGDLTQHAFDSTGLWSARPLSATVAIAENGQGSLLRTEDAGASWTPLAPLAGTSRSPLALPLASSERDLWWLISGQLMHSADAGRSWQAVTAPLLATGYELHDVRFADPATGWIVCSAGLVLRTTDGGQSWSAQQLPTSRALVSVVAIDRNTAWVLTDNGQLLATATAGE